MRQQEARDTTGAGIGLIVGSALGYVVSLLFSFEPAAGIGIGAALGLVFGGLIERLYPGRAR